MSPQRESGTHRLCPVSQDNKKIIFFLCALADLGTVATAGLACPKPRTILEELRTIHSTDIV